MLFACDPWESWVDQLARECELERLEWEREQDLRITRELAPPEVCFPEELPPRALAWWDHYSQSKAEGAENP